MEVPAELLSLLGKAKGITQNSREVKEGYIFFAVKGHQADGHDFIEDAVSKGAIAVVVEREMHNYGIPVFRVKDTRKTLALCSHLFYDRPSDRLNVIGITGTNGKTTTAYIIEKVINRSGKLCGLIGTVEYRLGSFRRCSGRTTPDPVTWHSTLREFLSKGAQFTVAEISSHALDQHRVYGTKFHGVIFTNLSQDHLDYHKDMEDYFRAKRRLFFEYESSIKVINSDDPYGVRLAKELGKEAITYGKEGELKIVDFETSFTGSTIELDFRGKRLKLRSNLIGSFQAYNISAAVAYLLSAGFNAEVIEEGIENIKVPGRFEAYNFGKFTVVIDYAHTPDALENVLRTANKLKKGRVITVFGAGGNRDKSKRAIMGEVASRMSDLIILTNDNPRWEDPMEIIKDILEGIRERKEVKIEPDRERAIKLAVEEAREGDIVLIAGKGHEDYQEIRGAKHPFSDREVVEKLMGRL